MTPETSLFETTVQLAEALVRIPSHNPPGNEDRIVAHVAGWLAKRGIVAESVPLEPGRSSLVTRIPGRSPGAIVLCGHLDTVCAGDSPWQHPPLGGEVIEDRLWGLGAADMKSGVAVLLSVAAHYAAADRRPRHDLVLALTADEEVAYRGAASIARAGHLDDAVCVLIAEPTSNRPLVGQKGELWLEAVFSGAEAHGSMPERGISSLLPAARFCTRLHQEVGALPHHPGRGHTTVNLGEIRGGRQVNIVPDRTSIEIDVRSVSKEHHDTVIDIIHRIGAEEAAAEGAGFACRILSDHPQIVSNSDHPEVKRLFEISSRALGETLRPSIVPYSTDAVSISPWVKAPILVCGPGDIGQAHRPDESISLEEIRVALEMMIAFVA